MKRDCENYLVAENMNLHNMITQSIKDIEKKDELIAALLKDNNALIEKVSLLEAEIDVSTVPRTMKTTKDKEIEDLTEKNMILRQKCEDLEEAGRRLAEQVREKDMELAQKDAKIRELESKLQYEQSKKQEKKQNDDLFEAGCRFFECLFGVSPDLNKEDTQ